MEQKKIANAVEREISQIFGELRSGMDAREDLRAFGAMVEKRVGDHWYEICFYEHSRY